MSKSFGVMIDCSRNAVMKPQQVNLLVDYLSSFGYNTIMLYTEDTYQVENQPYFGYLRGAYTQDEIKFMDNHAREKGVELIPCIQTLAHLNGIFRWRQYQEINDCNDILCAGLDKTYELIEDMFKTISKSFSSRKIHIGMDEAHMVGLGKYLDLNGYSNRLEILQKHLERVKDIAIKYGFKPIMWSDMFFRLANKGEYHTKNPKITQDAIDAAKGVEQVYWDYYHKNQKYYSNMMEKHTSFCGESWYAGGVWTWNGFAPYYTYTLNTMKPAMRACKQNNIENIILTMWGDNGKECSFFSQLPALFFLKKYYDGETNINNIKKEFKSLTGEDYNHFVSLEEINYTMTNKDKFFNPCKYTLYNDPFLSFYDTGCITGFGDSMLPLAKRYKKYAKQSKNFGYIFSSMADLCTVLSTKAELSKQIRIAYVNKDNEKLRSLINVINETKNNIQIFHDSFENLWMKENKPNGFEVQDIRLGGLIMRLETCKKRLQLFLEGKLDTLPELDEKILDYYGSGNTENVKEFSDYCNDYIHNCTVSIL